jgi:hypothetical protein
MNLILRIRAVLDEMADPGFWIIFEANRMSRPTAPIDGIDDREICESEFADQTTTIIGKTGSNSLENVISSLRLVKRSDNCPITRSLYCQIPLLKE